MIRRMWHAAIVVLAVCSAHGALAQAPQGATPHLIPIFAEDVKAAVGGARFQPHALPNGISYRWAGSGCDAIGGAMQSRGRGASRIECRLSLDRMDGVTEVRSLIIMATNSPRQGDAFRAEWPRVLAGQQVRWVGLEWLEVIAARQGNVVNLTMRAIAPPRLP